MVKASSLLWLLPLALLAVDTAESGNILMWMSFGSKSHFIVWQPLATELAKRGHSLTIVAPMKDKKLMEMPNVKFILLPFEELFETINSTEVFEGKSMDPMKLLGNMIGVQDSIFANEDIKRLVKDKPQFDVVIASPFCIDAGIYMAKHYFNAPVMFFFTAQSMPAVDRAMGNPLNSATDPMAMFTYGQYMSFQERLINTLAVTGLTLGYDYYFIPKMEKKIQEVLHLDHQPDLNELVNSADFALFNAFPIMDSVRPINPNTAFVGGLHLRPPRPLPDDLKKWMDDAKEGVVYVSFGSVLSGSQMPVEKQRILSKVFSGLKQKVLWKWETEDMPGKPSNVMLRKWLPQQDILGHPNLKMFVTHAGFGSLAEALYHGAPIVAMPGFADQFANGAKAEIHGFGRVVHWKDLTEEKLRSALEAVLSNSSMSAVAQEYSSVMKDDLVHPLQVAAHHVEYVIRHKGAKHLRSPASSLNFFQYFLLDVMAVVLLALLVVIFIIVKVFKVIIRATCGGDAKADSRKKKQ